jgi:ubiquitin-protein ligase
LKDLNNNNKFDPKKERFIIKHFITIPNDTVYELELFKETLLFKALNQIRHPESSADELCMKI